MTEQDKTFDELEAAGWTLSWDAEEAENGFHVARLTLYDDEGKPVHQVREGSEDLDTARSLAVRSANAYLQVISTDPH